MAKTIFSLIALLLICLAGYPLMMAIWLSPTFTPYRNWLVGIFSVPEYTKSSETLLTDFDGHPTLFIGCDRADAFCVQAIPLFDELARTQTGLTMRIVTLSDQYFSTTIPQIQASRFASSDLWTKCTVVPRYIVRSSTGQILFHSCLDDRSLANVLEKTIP